MVSLGAALSISVDSATADATTRLSVSDPSPPASVSSTVPLPYDDLSDRLCTGVSGTEVRIETASGRNQRDVWALAGDTQQFVGATKACQVVDAPGDVVEFGFTADELAWSIVPRGGTRLQLGSGTIVQDGRSAVPSISRIERTLVPEDDGSRLFFGAPVQVESPNGAGTAGATTSITLRVVNPKLELKKEVCTAHELSGCDAGDSSAWKESASVTAGSDVFWRLTATNAGNIELQDVRVSADELEGVSAGTNDCRGVVIADTLAPGASSSVACATTGVTGGRGTNAARLTSTFADESPSDALIARFPNGVESNVSRADVTVHDPALALVKQVCATGTGCDMADDTQWLPRTEVQAASAVEWRLTATNTGNVVLDDVSVSSEELSGGLVGVSTECASLTFGALEPGVSVHATCITPTVVDTERDTVNTAVVHGMPVDAAGVPLPSFTGGIDSNAAAASAIAKLDMAAPDPTEPGMDPAPGDTSPSENAGGAAEEAAPSAASGPESLALTGFQAGAIPAAVAAVLLMLGGALVVHRRRLTNS